MGSIFNSDSFSRNFITYGFLFFCFQNIFLSTDQFFNDDCLDLWMNDVIMIPLLFFKIINMFCSSAEAKDEFYEELETTIKKFPTTE